MSDTHLPTVEHRGLARAAGPLVVATGAAGVGYDEVVPLDAEAEGLLRLALLAHGEHPEVVEDYTARVWWAASGGGSPSRS